MSKQTGTQVPAQAGIEDFNGIFQERLRGIVRAGLLAMFEQEVTSLCGESYRPTEGVHRRAGSEMVTIQTTSGKERISKRRVRETLPSGLEREVRLKSYSEVKRRKGMFDEVVKGLFARLQARGLQAGAARRLLLVRDGSEAIAKAVRHFWPDAVQQECLVHVERGLCAKLSWKHHGEVGRRLNRLRGVQGAEAGEEAFDELVESIRKKIWRPRKVWSTAGTGSWRFTASMYQRRST